MHLSQIAGIRQSVYQFLANAYNLPAFLASLTPDSISPLGEGLAALAGQRLIGKECAQGFEIIYQDICVHMANNLTGWQQRIAIDRTRLARGINRRYGPPPPYESVYLGNNLLMTSHGAKVQECYRSGEWENTLADPPDYLGIELAFLAELSRRERERHEKERGETHSLIVTQRDFLQQHLGYWVPQYVSRAEKYVDTACWRGLLLLTKDFPQYDLRILDSLLK